MQHKQRVLSGGVRDDELPSSTSLLLPFSENWGVGEFANKTSMKMIFCGSQLRTIFYLIFILQKIENVGNPKIILIYILI